MGDRGNIVLQQTTKDGTGRIYLYTHWGGGGIGHAVQNALRRKERWDDPTYLGHIIYDALEDLTVTHGEPTGLGIGLYPSDNEHSFIVVDAEHETVTKETEAGAVERTWTFKEFIQEKLDDEWE